MHKITWYTRCPICWERIPLTDYDDPDLKIMEHRGMLEEETSD